MKSVTPVCIAATEDYRKVCFFMKSVTPVYIVATKDYRNSRAMTTEFEQYYRRIKEIIGL